MPTLVLRQFLKDRRTLAEAMAGVWPSLEQLRRRASVGEWERNSHLPDHVLRNRRDSALADADSEWKILKAVFKAFADEFLFRHDGNVHVDFDKFGRWQSELADLSPLPFLAFALWRGYGVPEITQASEVRRYIDLRLRPFEHTALLSPFDSHVEDLIQSQGLHDRHIHLNGSTEVDKVWQDQLADVRAAAKAIKAELPRLDRPTGGNPGRSMLAELYEQLGLTPNDVGHYLRVARRLRLALTDFALDGNPPFSLAELVSASPLPALDDRASRAHPLSPRLPGEIGKLIPEIMLLIQVFQGLDKNPGAKAGCWLHLYLLILNGMAVPLTIQSERQKGFDQFQKFTFTSMRRLSEGDSYVDRFKQLNCAPRQDLAVLEGRISPPEDSDTLKRVLVSILDGLSRYRGRQRVTSLEQEGLPEPEPAAGEPRMALHLVAHFIKKVDPDTQLITPWRHHALRKDLHKRWRALRHVRETSAIARRFLCGIDAAANEMHASPEVFAPVFRAARRSGMVHFTFHAGEDFEHLVSGIRAIAEAARFLNLRHGNRIGHGTAVGIDPELWLNRMPERLQMARGHYLDDLVFAHAHLVGDPRFGHVVQQLEGRIRDLSRHIYGKRLDPSLLHAAWALRKLDPVAIEAWRKREPAIEPDRRREIDRVQRAEAEHVDAFECFVAYHSRRVREAYARPELVDTAWLKAEALHHLQEQVLRDLASKQVAIETLPTSNVRISFYRDHSEHHIFRLPRSL